MMKKTLGRQKIEMKKMTNESHLQVTFSKRRAGLFKKACELNTLCGVELALVVFSPAKKVFCFGHPSVDTIVDRYLGSDTSDTPKTPSPIEDHRNANIRDLCMQINQASNQIEAEKERGAELDKLKAADQLKYWWKCPIVDLDLSQLLQLKSALEELKKKVDAEKLVVLKANLRQFLVGSSSTEGLTADNMTNTNTMSFIANMMAGEFGVPDKIVPTHAAGETSNPDGVGPEPEETDTVLTLGLGGGVV